MDNQFAQNGFNSLLLTLLTGITTFIFKDIDTTLKVGAFLTSLISMFFAARYYILASRHKKMEINQLSEKLKQDGKKE